MPLSFFIAIVIFILTYAIIISEKVHRTIIAIFGAILMIILGVLTQEEAIHGIDFNTIGLLIGMMVIVGISKQSGIFQYVAIMALKMGKGKPVPIFLFLLSITAIFSAFLDNVTTVLLIVPIMFVVADNLRLDPKPFLISAIMLSNIGGTATLIGDPPNILIGSAAGISFNEFLFNLAPIVIIISAVIIFLLHIMYGRKFKSNPASEKVIMNFNPREAIVDMSLLVKSLAVIFLVLTGFFTHSIFHFEVATIALAGAALLFLITVNEPEEHLKGIEWSTIFFFIGLFVLVAGLEKVGAIRMLAQGIISLTGGNFVLTAMAVLWGSAIFSAIIDNIPFVATMIPLVKDIGLLSGLNIKPLWWALALGADMGGNATIIGASANVVVAGMSEKEGHKIGFVEYMKIAVPLTFVALIISTAYMYFRYLL